MTTKWISTDAWRGYEEPIHAICGANDTGMWSDSPCPTSVCKSELAAVTSLLRKNGINYRSKMCQTSNVFCVHRYIVVPPKDVERGKEIVKEYLAENSTRLLYVC